MRGKIIKGIAGFYYVHTEEAGVFECRAKGIFRKDKVKPLVGDDVEIDVLNEKEREGNLIEILPRRNALIRPAVANVDQALVIFAVNKPKPNLNLLDRFLITMSRQGVDSVICFNKQDLGTQEEIEALSHIYRNFGGRVLFASAEKQQGLDELREVLQSKTTTVAGPSGVGKSSLINRICPQAEMETGEISRKLERGRHTTRHAELFYAGAHSYLMDTPGFSSLDLPQMEKEELSSFFPEFAKYEELCRFQGCAHDREPDCAVKAALAENKISRSRYENYLDLYHELQDRRRY